MVISFEDLKARIEKKEREIISHIERVVDDSLREAENYSRIIVGKISTLETISDTLKKVLNSSSQAELLDFYSENKEKIYSNIESELSILNNIDTSTNLRCVISPSSIVDHIDSIKAVQLQISSLKCIDEIGDKRYLEKTKRISQKNN